MSKKSRIPATATPVKGLDLTGNIARYGALFAREVIGALKNGGDYGHGRVAVSITVTVDMDEAQNLANATKSVVVSDVRKDAT
ncbi:hypothetical protein I6F26_10295 [Ensifer sp. IC3342]|nr:hypothetical protein [Ensifer sp. BRP08]MCA1446969.1 hypothetical protein [Ensifer sp. IC3342]